MNASRIVFATFIAILALALVLQQAAAEPGPRPGLAEEPLPAVAAEPSPDVGEDIHRMYLPMLAADVGSSSRSHTSTPNAAISVAAQSVLSCDTDEAMPVGGARITVVSDRASRVAMTDASGFVLFSATAAPAVIQIEWPAGYLPCPNSRPLVELPSGTGEVEFTAIIIDN